MVNKDFIASQQLLEDSYKLGANIYNDKFRPNYLVALWRGGCFIGASIHEYLKYMKLDVDHIAIRTSSYEGQNQKKEISVHGLGYLIERMTEDDSLLIVDDVFDSGLTIEKVLTELKSKMKKNLPKDIRIATIYYKPKNNKSSIKPDYYLHETDKWLVFPHELEDLTKEEVINGKGENIWNIMVKYIQK
jgi:uncharacterized protein